MTLRVSPDEVIDRLERARVPGPSGMAFDADGTLWSGDVGDDVFEFAYTHDLFRDAARTELARVAQGHDIPGERSASEYARAIHAGYRRGVVDERLMCEVMTWSYAGFSTDELRAVARKAFDARGLASRVRRELSPILDWARREALRVVVVSASPTAIVSEALDLVGISVFDIAGAVPEMAGGRVAPRMAGPVPYAEVKSAAGSSLLSGHDWLASFGDNSFDVELLRAARLGVAVHPKPALSARLGEIDGVLVLR